MKVLPRSLTQSQKIGLASKLNIVADYAEDIKGFAAVSSTDALYDRAASLIRNVVDPAPSALLFLRQEAGNLELEKTFYEQVPPKNLGISKANSPLNFSAQRMLITYIPDVSLGKLLVCDPQMLKAKPDSAVSELSAKESGIKLTKGLKNQFKSIAAVPLFSRDFSHALGVMFMGWQTPDPVDYMLYLEVFGVIAHQISKKLPAGLKAL